MAIDYSRALNAEQLDVVLHGDGPCLVLAGAGSGKTRTIVYRVAHLLESGVLPQEILLLTFTNKAANEMLGRIERLLGRGADGIWGGTFHKVANRILRRYGVLLGYQPNFSILDEEDALDLLKLSVKDVGVATTERRFPAPTVLRSVISLSRNARRELREVLVDRHPSFARVDHEVEAVAQRYAERKRQANAMDFDDLLVNFLEILTVHPATARTLAQQFRFVLVDEYQDTNHIQAAIVDWLASVHGNVLVVGDDAQSIYSFRAADVEHILGFPIRFPGARTFRIETNYRSTPAILRVANAVIAANEAQFRKKLRPVRSGGDPPRLVRASTAMDEARYIAEQILTLRQDGVSLREVAVLFRATHLSEFLELELVKRDIPYDYRGGIRFFERAHVKDVLAFLRILVNPHDEAAWLRVLRLQPGIGDVGAMEVMTRVWNLESRIPGATTAPSWMDAPIVLPSRLDRGWRAFLDMAVPLATVHGPAAIIRALVAKGSYREHLESEYPDWEERIADLEQLAVFAEQYAECAAFVAETSLQELFRAERVGPDASERDRMVLSTIHQAKGLEWRAVFVMGLTAAAFPNRRALLEEGGVEEERRLFYVAVTRAQELLTLSYALTGGGESSYLHAPSPFLDEIPAELVEPIGFSRVSARSWGHGEADDVIAVDAMGERVHVPASTNVWKNESPDREERPTPRRGFLRDVGDL